MARAPRLAEHPELGLPETRKLWHTEGLFSDHYLKTRIARNAWWPNDADTEPERSDVVRDLLAFLAQEMTRLNAEKRAAARGFIVDLKDFHGVDAHALTPKTRLDEFWKLDAAELFAHLRKNTRRLAEPSVHLTATDEEKIRECFTGAKGTIVPLESHIAATDALIDQIVYRLYGLTNEEVALVKFG